VGGGEQRRRYREAERLGGPEIDRELEFCRQFYRKVARPLTIENAGDINAGTTIGVRLTRSIADQPAGCNESTEHIARRDCVECSKPNDLAAPAVKKRTSANQHCTRTRLC